MCGVNGSAMLWIRSWRWSADLLIGEWISSVVDQIQERQGEPRRDQERPGEPAQESPGASRTVANLACGRPAVELEWQILAAIGSAAQGCQIGLRTSCGRAGNGRSVRQLHSFSRSSRPARPQNNPEPEDPRSSWKSSFCATVAQFQQIQQTSKAAE